MAVNLTLASAKLAAGILGHSNALIGDAVESIADLFSSLIVWRGLSVASAPPDADHPYGHGKAEPLAAAAVAMLLLFAAVGIAVKSAGALFARHHSPEPFTLWVLFGVILTKEALFRFAWKEGTAMESSAVRSDAWHHRSDAITSLAAAIGIAVALIGGPRWAGADDVAAILAAGIIAWNGTRLLRPALRELMDAAPTEELHERIRELAADHRAVCAVEKCLARKMGVQLFVDLHLEVDPGLTVARAHEIAHAVKDRIRENLPEVADVLVHIEPHHRPEPPVSPDGSRPADPAVDPTESTP
ncbi:MAG: cation transporter [Verrucomicrobiales bacterium]|nr:cation transporter [Verrucomicrobiales bacterium]MCP5527875.1 cation transporter [Verrucomicrobiales bacterium]